MYNNKDGCCGCAISLGDNNIRINKYWVINHYGGSEGFLGWVALQPYYHRNSFDKLTDNELFFMGKTIAIVKAAIKIVLNNMFPDDIAERVYFLYLYESIFDDPPTKYHMHFHLVPRMKSYKRHMMTLNGDGINAYKIAEIRKCIDVKYIPTDLNKFQFMLKMKAELSGMGVFNQEVQ